MTALERKVLLLEDTMIKAVDIERALKYSGIRRIRCFTNQEAGIDYLKQEALAGEPVNLIVTDMHYPLTAGSIADYAAGEKLMKRLVQEGIDVPVICCSTHNYTIPGTIGTVWYNPLRDLNADFFEILSKLERNNE